MFVRSYCPSASSVPTQCPPATYGSVRGLQTAACSGMCEPGMKICLPITRNLAWYYHLGKMYLHNRKLRFRRWFDKQSMLWIMCPWYVEYQYVIFWTKLLQLYLFLIEPGKFSTIGSVACENCAAGSFSSSSKSITCSSCGAGSFSADGASICTPCPPDTFASSMSATSCSPCGPSLHAGPGSSVCIPCTWCSVCTAGSYTIATGCVACDPGSYSIQSNVTACTACAAGFYGSQAGLRSGTCTATCPRGYDLWNKCTLLNTARKFPVKFPLFLDINFAQ